MICNHLRWGQSLALRSQRLLCLARDDRLKFVVPHIGLKERVRCGASGIHAIARAGIVAEGTLRLAELIP